MNTAEIDCILRRALEPLEVRFTGVFAADTIPNACEYPFCFVINTDPASKPGEHWVACYVTSPSKVEFFDSYGMPVEAYPNIRLPYTVTKHNTVSLQDIGSYACGHYCIYYLCNRAQGTSLSRIVERLSILQSARREYLIRRFVVRTTCRLRVRRPCSGECVGLQCCGKRIL